MDSATWVIAAFAIVLAVTTIIYTAVSFRLLNESKKASREPRIAFLTDAIVRTLDLERELVKQDLSSYGRYYDKPEKLHKDIGQIFAGVGESLREEFTRAMERFQE